MGFNDTATKIPVDDSMGTSNQNNINKKERLEQLKKLTQIYEWCEFINKRYGVDLPNSYIDIKERFGEEMFGRDYDD